jgi:hypothetical protein
VKLFLKNKNNFFAKNHFEIQVCTILVHIILDKIQYTFQTKTSTSFWVVFTQNNSDLLVTTAAPTTVIGVWSGLKVILLFRSIRECEKKENVAERIADLNQGSLPENPFFIFSDSGKE